MTDPDLAVGDIVQLRGIDESVRVPDDACVAWLRSNPWAVRARWVATGEGWRRIVPVWQP